MLKIKRIIVLSCTIIEPIYSIVAFFYFEIFFLKSIFGDFLENMLKSPKINFEKKYLEVEKSCAALNGVYFSTH